MPDDKVFGEFTETFYVWGTLTNFIMSMVDWNNGSGCRIATAKWCSSNHSYKQRLINCSEQVTDGEYNNLMLQTAVEMWWKVVHAAAATAMSGVAQCAARRPRRLLHSLDAVSCDGASMCVVLTVRLTTTSTSSTNWSHLNSVTGRLGRVFRSRLASCLSE